MNNLLTTIYFLHFFNDGIRTAFVTLLPFIGKDFHLNFTQIGILGAAQGTLSMLLAVPMGIITSKINNIKLLFFALFIYAVCAFGIGISPNYVLLLLFFYIAAAAFAPFHIIGQSATARSSTKETRGTTMGTFATIGDSGRVALPAIALFFATYLGWRNTYLITAFFLVLILGILLWILHNKKHIFKKATSYFVKENSKDWLKQMFIIFRQKELLYITLGSVIDGIGGASIYIYLPFLLLTKGIAPSLLYLFMGGYFCGSLVGKKYLAKGVDFYGPTKIFIYAELLMALLLIFLSMQQNSVVIFLITGILGIFTRGTAPVVATLFTTVSHEAHYEKVYTISEIFLGGTAVLSPIILGKTADFFGINTSFYLAAGCAVLAIVPIYLYAKAFKLSRNRISKNQKPVE